MQRLLTRGIGHSQFRQTRIGEIPATWEVSTIGNECKVGSGGTPSRKFPEYFRGNISWVKTTELNYCVIMDTEEKISEKAINESAAKIYPKGTFVIAMVGLEAKGTRGKCAILGIDAAVNQACAAVQTPENINTHFLFYYYQTITNKVMSLAAGTKRQNLNLELVKSIEIPIPSVKEQQKIASIINLVDMELQKEIEERSTVEALRGGLIQKLLTGKIRSKI